MAPFAPPTAAPAVLRTSTLSAEWVHMRDDSIQTAYRRVVEGEPTVPAGSSSELALREDLIDELSLDIVVELRPASGGGHRARENDLDASMPHAVPSDASIARAEARLAWSRVRALEETLAATRAAADENRTALDRAQVERDTLVLSAIRAWTEHEALVGTVSRAVVERDALHVELADVKNENARLHAMVRRAEVDRADAAVIRRGLADDLRSWRRRALDAEAVATSTTLALSGDDDAAWRQAAALAQRLAAAEERAAAAEDDATQARRERDQLEATLATLAEAVNALELSEDAWSRAAEANERLAGEREDTEAELAAAQRVHASLVQERDAAHRALEALRERHDAAMRVLRAQLRRQLRLGRPTRGRPLSKSRKQRQRDGGAGSRSSAR